MLGKQAAINLLLKRSSGEEIMASLAREFFFFLLIKMLSLEPQASAFAFLESEMGRDFEFLSGFSKTLILYKLSKKGNLL